MKQHICEKKPLTSDTESAAQKSQNRLENFSIMQSVFATQRLVLIQLTETLVGSQHVQWFHNHWNDEEATSWSLHGKCHTIEESREWLIEHLTKNDTLYYCCFSKTPTGEGTETDPGEQVGLVSLRRQAGGPVLQPPASFSEPLDQMAGAEPNDNTWTGSSLPLNLRAIAYAFFQQHRGKGYATEAGKALIEEYARSVAEEKRKGEEIFYIEAGVDADNPESLHVLKKLGFRKVGWKEEKEPVFLNKQWREGGYWIYGLYV